MAGEFPHSQGSSREETCCALLWVSVWDISALALLPHHHSGFPSKTFCIRCSTKRPLWPFFLFVPSLPANLLPVPPSRGWVFTTLSSQCTLCHLGHMGTGKEQPQAPGRGWFILWQSSRADLSNQEDLREDLIKGRRVVAMVHWGGHRSWKNLPSSCQDLCTSW